MGRFERAYEMLRTVTQKDKISIILPVGLITITYTGLSCT